MCVCVCVRVRVRVYERDKQTDRQRQRVRLAQRERASRDGDMHARALSHVQNGTTIKRASSKSEDDEKKKGVEASLLQVLAKTYGPALVQSWFCKVLYDLLQFVSPQLLE